MPEQEPTPWELLRAINRIEASIREYSTRFDRLVSHELFQAYQLEVARRFTEVKEDVTNRKNEHDADLKLLREQQRREEDNRRQLKLIAFSAAIVAVLGFFSSLALQLIGT